MTVTQTIEVPADRQLLINVPREVPTGPTILIFKPLKTPNAVTLAAMQETDDIISGKKPCVWYKSSDDFIDALKNEIEN